MSRGISQFWMMILGDPIEDPGPNGSSIESSGRNNMMSSKNLGDEEKYRKISPDIRDAYKNDARRKGSRFDATGVRGGRVR